MNSRKYTMLSLALLAVLSTARPARAKSADAGAYRQLRNQHRL